MANPNDTAGGSNANANAHPNGGSTSSAGTGGFDLLKRATQAMMMSSSSTRPAAGDDDGVDQIGLDTPRSGVATPQPDLHDKRLPGIMSYFNQVRTRSTRTSISGASAAPSPAEAGEGTESRVADASPDPAASSFGSRNITAGAATAAGVVDAHDAPEPVTSPPPPPPLPPAPASQCGEMSPSASREVPPPSLHQYPTPPESRHPSRECLTRRTSVPKGGLPGEAPPPARPPLKQKSSTSDAHSYPFTNMPSALSSIVTAPVNVHAPHLSNPRASASQPLSSPSSSQPAAGLESAGLQTGLADLKLSSPLEELRKLTRAAPVKSGPPTPTRALSSAHPSDDRAAPKRSSNEMGPPSGTQTPRAGVAQVPAAKGKLAIKIVEARGLRKSRDPYVVAVFQRNELISGPPQSYQDEDDVNMPVPGMGGVAIQRQGSDSGRPAVSIPMRSRQSSSTSITDHNNFRNRAAKQSFTNPAWDAEAIFDVIDSDMLINLSVYAHGSNGEEFLGHVDIQASMDTAIHGWYAISGHVDTMAENAPTGEIYVEAEYQRVERKHFGPEDFQILKLIGKGTFGQVYQVRKKDTGRIYAMKVLSKKVIVQKKEVAHTVGERNILVRTATTDSPFIVGLKFSFQTPSDLYLVTDYMSGGELFWHLQKEGRFDEKRAKFYIAELILAIEHLHRNDIVYRDLKPENILLDANGHIALCDFGLSKANLTKNDTTNTFCGTTEYLAPEVLLDESGYTKMVDFWSLGVLVFEMCCGWSPFYAEDTQQMYKNIAFGKVRFPRDTLSQEGRNFVKGLLNRNPKHRLGATLDAEELKRHAFFDDIDWEALGKKLITPPFKPKLKSATDVSYFDPEFTNALDNSGSLNERAAALARGFATSTPLSPSVQANFQGFTFVDESALDDHMKDRRGGYDDEDMNDARQDDDWDDLGDIAPRRGGDNRMSGIERTSTRDNKDDSHDDQMICNSHFDL